jgi:DNA-binding ferritin-like protein
MTIPSPDVAAQRGTLIKLLENAMELAEDLEDGTTAYLIERALDEARSQHFVPKR